MESRGELHRPFNRLLGLGLENFGPFDVAGGALILLAIFHATNGKPLRGYLKNSIVLPTPRERAKS